MKPPFSLVEIFDPIQLPCLNSELKDSFLLDTSSL